ncbi:19839_t:CDS:2 [Funneliformis geosporum]|uniref:6658_t:CDS:1 n=1 Tax=Funneliformis geosporum TaxID=1117311 RepID=A0A9W4SSC0_9GLOM|nr:19839_t:CDS:2 [Funneliformis geosporum]CAI2178804.1 6658_t:CDS:2 [Funneliformis geosporum]
MSIEPSQVETPKNIAIIGIQDEYTRKIIINSFKKILPDLQIFKFSKTTTTFTFTTAKIIHWLEYEDIDFFNRTLLNKHSLLINSYCIRKGLIRKANFNFNIRKYLSKNPNSILKSSIPETWFFEVTHKDYLDEALEEIFEVVNECKDNDERINEEKVKFILKPSLAVSNLQVYLYKDMLALFALNAYAPTEINDFLSHLTNTCLQMNEISFKESNQVKLFWDLTKDNEGEKGMISKLDLEMIFNQIKSILNDCFDSIVNEVTQFMPMENAFELFGFDFLVDHEKNAYLLEANSTGDGLSHVISKMFEDTIKLAIIPFFEDEEFIKDHDSKFCL